MESAMPYKINEFCRHHFKKAKYKVKNWGEYNKSLQNRGSLTIWFDDNAIKKWYAKSNEELVVKESIRIQPSKRLQFCD